MKDKVLQYLNANHPNEYNALTIAKALKIKHHTCNMLLSRLHREGLIERVHYGFYRARKVKKIEDLDITDVRFHSLHMVATLSFWEGYPGSLSPVHEPQKNDIKNKEKIDYWIVEGNKKIFEYSWYARRVRIEVSPSAIEVWLACSNNPLSIPEFQAFLCFLEGVFFPDFYSYNWRFDNWGINIDRTEFWLNGLNSITMRDAIGLIVRFYNKKGMNALRHEVHGSYTVTLDNIINYLKGKVPLGIADLREEVRLLQDCIKELSNDNKRTRAMLTRFLEILHTISPNGLYLTYDIRPAKKEGFKR